MPGNCVWRRSFFIYFSVNWCKTAQLTRLLTLCVFSDRHRWSVALALTAAIERLGGIGLGAVPCLCRGGVAKTALRAQSRHRHSPAQWQQVIMLQKVRRPYRFFYTAPPTNLGMAVVPVNQSQPHWLSSAIFIFIFFIFTFIIAIDITFLYFSFFRFCFFEVLFCILFFIFVYVWGECCEDH